MVKIGISGKARSGKDTVTDLIIEHFENKVPETSSRASRKFSFAFPIKKIILQMFPTTPLDILWGPSENRSKNISGTNLTYRQLLLDIGKFGRNYDPDLWVSSTLEEIKLWMEYQKEFVIDTDFMLAIISDIRFKNEYLKLKDNNYYLIRVVRPNNDYSIDDISETGLDHIADSEFDMVIVNDSTIENLKEKIKAIPVL